MISKHCRAENYLSSDIKYAPAYAVCYKRIASRISLGLGGGIQFNIDARNQRKNISGRPPNVNENSDVTLRLSGSFTLCIQINMQCQLNLTQETISLKTSWIISDLIS